MYPIELQFQTGSTVYVVIHNPDGSVWNANTKVWEDYNGAHWGEYAIGLEEQANSGYYRSDYPAEIGDDPDRELTSEACYSQQGPDPALGDPGIGLGQTQGVSVEAIDGNVRAADILHSGLASQMQGTAEAGTLTKTEMTTNLEDTTDDVYVGRILIMTSGAAIRQVANIKAYDGDTKKLTFSPLSVAPALNDQFLIV